MIKKLTNSIFFVLILLFTLAGCNDLPDDLQQMKDDCNSRIEELLTLEDRASTIFDYKILAEQFKNLKSDMITYDNECNSRGYKKDNQKTIDKISKRIVKYEKLIRIENDKIQKNLQEIEKKNKEEAERLVQQLLNENNNGQEISNDEDYYAYTTCNWCEIGKYNSKGICNMCNSASPTKVEKTYSSQYKSCMGCNATGWRNGDVCPICNGKGKYLPF